MIGRTPWVAEKIEAGDEGAVNGNRLLLTLGSALSWHLRGLFLGASTPTEGIGRRGLECRELCVDRADL